jgi:enterochelin esterase-like enzyme
MRRRSLYWLLALVWIGIGLVGAYSYLYNYNEHRGFATVKRQPGVHPGRQLWVHFYSPSLGRQADYLVYLPTGYDPMRRYPVFYLLHGLPGRPQAYIKIADVDARLDNLLSQRRTAPMILVFPDGRIHGDAHSDSEWANTRAGRFEDYVVDVVHDVDGRFTTSANRSARVIAGYSAGAYGALNIALHHLDVFGSVQVWSGYFAVSRHGVFAHAGRSAIAANSPINYVAQLRTGLAADPLNVFLDGGRDDHDTRRIVRMAVGLKAAGATVGYALWPGGHDWEFWHAHLNQMLVLAGNDVLGVRGQAVPVAPAVPVPHRGHRGHRRIGAHGRRHHHAARRTAHRAHRHRAAHVAGRPAKHAALRPRRAVAAPLTRPLPPAPPTRAAQPRRKVLTAGGPGRAKAPSALELISGLLLALVSAAAINLGFLLQHRGLGEGVPAASGTWPMLRCAVRSRSWLAGQALGWAGFAAQVTAVVIAPLSLVQAFAAGGLALSVPLAAGVFGHRISREQVIAVLLIAVGLASLPIALGGTGEHLQTRALTISIGAALALTVPVALSRTASSRAITAGLFYGVADAAIKAISVRWGSDGAGALISGWTLLALIGTFGGFLAFQASLRDGSAVAAISLMTALATLVALSCGLLAFGESLGNSPVAVAAHLVAVALVLACVPTLAAAQTEMSASEDRQDAAGRRLRARIRAALQSAQRATGSEQQRFDPWTRPGPPAPDHVAEAHISSHRERNLGGNQQQDDAEYPGEGGSPEPRETGEHHTGQHAGR